ncbi:hypothetical protein V1478_008835 [Vespula squamosa]|uniref:Uncharacterized protein n=1 Tax=Vespula squamosa TaxID=30214 RepID=A0ABD2AUM3_VESSQ
MRKAWGRKKKEEEDRNSSTFRVSSARSWRLELTALPISAHSNISSHPRLHGIMHHGTRMNIWNVPPFTVSSDATG